MHSSKKSSFWRLIWTHRQLRTKPKSKPSLVSTANQRTKSQSKWSSAICKCKSSHWKDNSKTRTANYQNREVKSSSVTRTKPKYRNWNSSSHWGIARSKAWKMRCKSWKKRTQKLTLSWQCSLSSWVSNLTPLRSWKLKPLSFWLCATQTMSTLGKTKNLTSRSKVSSCSCRICKQKLSCSRELTSRSIWTWKRWSESEKYWIKTSQVTFTRSWPRFLWRKSRIFSISLSKTRLIPC